MWVRKRLDIGWGDLAAGLLGVARRGDRERIAERIERSWPGERGTLVCLSVRSGFDLLLEALALPQGSEVLVSALTIPDMIRILHEHGLVPVPVDLDCGTAGPGEAELRSALSPRTRAMLVAHLFGGRLELGPVVKLARERDLVLIEDCAQAFEGDGWSGDPQADVSMFSFGIIKTATALGGAVLCVRDAPLRERMRERERAWPVQSSLAFARRVARCGLLKLLSGRCACGALMALLRGLGIDADRALNRSVRGFAGADFFRRIRQRPAAALLGLLERRLAQDHAARVAQRRQSGERLAAALASVAMLPGRDLERHSYWVFPVGAPNPPRLINDLRAAGFDATQGSSLCTVEPPAGSPPPAVASRLLMQIVYLPCYSRLPERDVERLAEHARRSLASNKEAQTGCDEASRV